MSWRSKPRRMGLKPIVLKNKRKPVKEIAIMMKVHPAYVRKTLAREKDRINGLDF